MIRHIDIDFEKIRLGIRHWEYDKVWEIKKYIVLIATKISFSQKVSNNSLRRKDTVSQLDARTVVIRRKPKRDPVASVDINLPCPHSI